MSDITKFITAQEHFYQTALQEIKDGEKVSHWMWFIFPQIAGLGRSPMAKMYAIESKDEAKEYLEHEVLGSRLREISKTLLEHKDKQIVSILGHTDAMKLRSSMTLFDAVSPDDVFSEVLAAFYDSKRDRLTLDIIGSCYPTCQLSK